jgi:hypothetical protein
MLKSLIIAMFCDDSIEQERLPKCIEEFGEGE